MAVAAEPSRGANPAGRHRAAPARVLPRSYPEDPNRDQLRQVLAEDREALGPPGAHLFSDPRLQRFLDGNEGNVQEAAAHFRRMLQVRREARMEEVIRPRMGGRPWETESVEGLDRFFNLMATTVPSLSNNEGRDEVSGYTPDGHMLMVFRDGIIKIDEVMAAPEDELFTCMYGMCELREDHMDELSYERSKLVKCFHIRDLAGLSIAKIARDAFVMQRVQRVTSTISTAYPETVQRVFLINVPTTFSLLWALMKPLFNARTREKMVFADDEFLPQLAAEVGAQGLEALASAFRDAPPNDGPSLTIGNGAGGYVSQRLGPAEQAAWSFQVEPTDASATFLVIFCPDGENPTLQYVVGPAEKQGVVQGRYRANSKGLLFFSWKNPSSWTGSSLYIDSWTIHVGGHADDVRGSVQRAFERLPSRERSETRVSGGARTQCAGNCFAFMPRRPSRRRLQEQPLEPASPTQRASAETAVGNHCDMREKESCGRKLSKANKSTLCSADLPALLVPALMLLLLLKVAYLAAQEWQ